MIDLDLAITVLSGLLLVIAAVHMLLAFGWRRGSLVWGSYHPRRLPTQLRQRSLGFGILLLISALLLLEAVGFKGIGVISERWDKAIGFVLTSFLGLTGLYVIFRNNAWERFVFGPILLLSAITTGLLTF